MKIVLTLLTSIFRFNTKSKIQKDFIWTLFSHIILGLSGILLNVIILNFRGDDVLGIFNQVFAVYIIVSQIAVGGVQFSVLKHISYEYANVELCSVISISAIILTLIISSVVAFTLYLFSEKIGLSLDSHYVAEGIKCISPGIIFYSLNKVLFMVLNGLRRMKAFSIFQSLRFILIISFVVIIINISQNSSMLLLALSITEIILTFFLFIYIYSSLFHFSLPSTPVLKTWMSKHLSFGMRGFLSGVLIEMNTKVDVLILGIFTSDSLVGIFSFASTIAEGFAQLNIVVRQNIDPLIGNYFSKNDKESIHLISGKIKDTFFPLMAIIGFLIVIIYPIVLSLMDRQSIAESWSVFSILIVGIVIASRYRPFVAILLQGGRPGLFTILMFTTVLLNILFNIILVPHIGILGSAVSTSMVYLFEAYLIFSIAKRIFGITL